eukprot:213747-Chlamydomonas_euryale.AAC.3
MGRRMTQGKRGTARPGVCTKTASDVVVSLYVGALRHMRCCLCAHGSMAAHSLLPVRAWQHGGAFVGACARMAACQRIRCCLCARGNEAIHKYRTTVV